MTDSWQDLIDSVGSNTAKVGVPAMLAIGALVILGLAVDRITSSYSRMAENDFRRTEALIVTMQDIRQGMDEIGDKHDKTAALATEEREVILSALRVLLERLAEKGHLGPDPIERSNESSTDGTNSPP